MPRCFPTATGMALREYSFWTRSPLPPAVSAAAYQLILDRRLGVLRIPEHWAILPPETRRGSRRYLHHACTAGRPLFSFRG